MKKILAFLLGLSIIPLMGPSGGYPSSPTFQNVTVTAPTGTINSVWLSSTSGQSANLTLESVSGINALGFCVSDTAAVCTTATVAHDAAEFFSGNLHFANSNGTVDYGRIGAANKLPVFTYGLVQQSGATTCALQGNAVTQSQNVTNCTSPSTGNVTINFTVAYSNPPACTANVNANNATANVAATASTVLIGTMVAGVATNSVTVFQCVGN